MNQEHQQKILKHLDQNRQNIIDIEPHIESVEGCQKHLMNARLEILTVYDIVKMTNQKEEDNGKKKTVQHSIEG